MERFTLYARGFVPLKNRRLSSGYEILLTIRNIDTSLQALSELLSAQHQGDSPDAIDRWVLAQTLTLLNVHAEALCAHGLTLALPLSAHCLHDERFAEHFCAQLAHARVPSELLTVQFSERSALTDLASAARVLRKLTGAGCSATMQGFGADEQAYQCLRDLPIARVKLDGDLCRHVASSAAAANTVHSLIQLLRGFPVRSIAEGVDTPAAAKKLRALGVDYAQGSMFGAPQPLERLLDSLGHGLTGHTRIAAADLS
jgi:EAL domain-containing protein (putative c-di-GMP-specific phosphodiesterase class I)